MDTWREKCGIRIDPGPLGYHLENFAHELVGIGYAELSIYGYLSSGAHFAYWLTSEGIALDRVDGDTVDAFATHRCECPLLPRRAGCSPRYVRRVLRFLDFLRRQGIIAPEPVPPGNEALVIVEFREWLSSHRGLRPSSIKRISGEASRLYAVLGDDPAGYTAGLIRETVCAHAKRGTRAQAKCITAALRAFLRFLASRGRLEPQLISAVPTVPQWRLSTLPRYLPEADIERVIGSCDTSKPLGLRDRAVLLLLSRLGMRAGDIVAMKRRDIDWDTGTVRVSGKNHVECRLPMPQETGDALIAYLVSARPEAPLQQVFLCANAPWRPFAGPAVVSGIVAAAVRRAGIEDPPSHGANLLRHSAATSMLRAGLELEAVSAVLRHRSVNTTAHYAKVDVRMLQQVAQPWPGVPHVD